MLSLLFISFFFFVNSPSACLFLSVRLFDIFAGWIRFTMFSLSFFFFGFPFLFQKDTITRKKKTKNNRVVTILNSLENLNSSTLKKHCISLLILVSIPFCSISPAFAFTIWFYIDIFISKYSEKKSFIKTKKIDRVYLNK